MDKIDQALADLKNGKFVLVHDEKSRENETDFVVAAEHATPKHIATMRRDGGGIICAAVEAKLADRLGLPFQHEILEHGSQKFRLLSFVGAHDIPYDEKSSFSLAVNHRKTFTGVTDEDRALTLSELAKLCGDNPTPESFGASFRSPGHIFLLLSSNLEGRQGHTELSTALVEMAGLTPVAAICEMMDEETHKALSAEGAARYARRRNIVFLEGDEILLRYLKYKDYNGG